MFTKQIRQKYFYKADFITLIFDSFTPRFFVMIDKPNFPATSALRKTASIQRN